MSRSDSSRRLLLISLLAALAACGDDAAGIAGDAGTTPDAGGGASSLLLTRVGGGTVEANPGDKLTLLALLSRSEMGPVAGADVDFRIAENPGGTVLGDATVVTDATGVAGSQLTVGASTGTVTVIASSEGAVSKAVWKVNVVPVVKRLRIVPGSNTEIDPNNPSIADVEANPTMQVPLRVRVVAESGEGERPLFGEQVTFSLLNGIDQTRFIGQSTQSTPASGEASVNLFVGDTTGEVMVAASVDNLSVTWKIHVKPPAGGGTCQFTAQCPAGLVCREGVCVGTSGGGGCDTNDRPCPIGYTCNADNGMCEMSVAPGCDHCPEFFQCNDAGTACVPENPECDDAGLECPSGFECVNGLCAPETDDPNVIDVSGYWYTKHKFDVRDALPGWVKFSADGIRIIDQIVLGQLNLPSWVNAIISGLVQQYVPSWVVTLVGILDAAFTVFSDLESEGEMELTRNGSRSILRGDEYWTKFVFHFLPLCNGNIQAPPGQQPACARMDIYTDELAAADLAVNVKPFAARVVGDPTKYTLFVDNRTVDMNFQGLLMYALDYAIELATGYPSLEEALPSLIDCPGLAQMVRDMGLPMDVTGLCRTAVAAGTKALVDQISGADVTQRDTLSFRGSATAFPSQAEPQKAELLGRANYLTVDPADGVWDGRFKLVFGVNDVPGRWRAAREPIPAGH